MVIFQAYVNRSSYFTRFYLPVPKFRASCGVGVSKKDISFINQYLCRKNFGENPKFSTVASKQSDKYLFNRYLVINPTLIGLRVSVYQGMRFHSFRVRCPFVGAMLGNFVRTRKFSPNIGVKKKHGYIGARSKKNGRSIK